MANNKVLLPSSVLRSHESELESIKNKVGSEGVSAEDIERAKSIISTILSKKELGALIDAINSGNTRISGLKSKVKSSSRNVYESVTGNVIGLITPERLKTVLQVQEKEQVKKGGPFDLISESIKTVNDNLGHTARIIKAVLQLQLITMAGVLKNAEVETLRAQKLARLSEKLNSSDLNLEELLDYSLELDDYASNIDLSLGNVKNDVVSLKKEVERIASALTQLKDTQQNLSQKIEEAKVAAETKATNHLAEAEKRLTNSISDAQATAVSKASEQLAAAEKSINEKIQLIQQNALDSIKASSESIEKSIEKAVVDNHISLRRKIVLSYILGSIGVVCSVVILILSLLHII